MAGKGLLGRAKGRAGCCGLPSAGPGGGRFRREGGYPKTPRGLRERGTSVTSICSLRFM